MTDARVEFALVPLAELRAHERIEEENVGELVEEIRSSRVFADPIWVARGSLVILNGHHRVEAARRLKLERVPAWLFDYDSDVVSLEPWRPGLPITKAEVIDRAHKGDLFPPKTTRHRIRIELPSQATALDELLPRPTAPRAKAQRSAPRRRSRSAGGRSRPG